MPVHLTCRKCGGAFTRPPGYVRRFGPELYCSRDCTENRVTVPCVICGASFETRTAPQKRARYCSPACRDRRPVPVEERFWRYVDKDGPVPEHCPELGRCWLWTGEPDRAGYGRLTTWTRQGGKGSVKVHRLSLSMAMGRPLANSEKALHRCDVRLCVNPAHLYAGTPADNSADAVERLRMPFGERNVNAKLTSAQVLEIRARYANGGVRQADLAAEYGVGQAAISRVVRRAGWHHV